MKDNHQWIQDKISQKSLLVKEAPEISCSNFVFDSTVFLQTSEGPYRMRIYERPNFQGQMMEFSEDCESLQEHFRSRDIYSCNVMEGYWTLYEHPSYRGRQYFLRPGEYRKFSDWGATCATTGSFRRITDF